MDHQNFTRLSSAEVGNLWYHHITDSMVKQILSYFDNCCQDTDIKPVVKQALQSTETNLDSSRQIMTTESMVFPMGFTESDVDKNAPRLFSDSLILYYLKHFSRQETLNYSMSFSTATRVDIRSFFEQAIGRSIELDKKVTEVLLAKGLLVKPPHVPIPTKVKFVESESFLGRIIGSNRMLDGMEIGLLHVCLDLATMTKGLLTGFSQVCDNSSVRDYFLRGIDVSRKHLVTFSDVMIDDDLPSPMSWDPDISESTTPPFSDKLMLFHATTIASYVFKMYGWGMSSSTRSDLHVDYARLSLEVMNYSKEGIQLLIKNGWMEQPPLASNRRELALNR